jgi:outer membrane receptor protein involved in Fe transport
MPRFHLNRAAIAATFLLGAACFADDDTVELAPITIKLKRLDAARNGLSTDTGSSVYNFDASDIETLPLGASTPINQVLLQAPGVVQDSYGQLHVRGDHANVQYRINGVLIPEPISGFGPSIDTRFANNINFLTGALPAQYGYRTAGVVDIQTKGADELENGGEIGTVIGTNGHRELNGSLSGVSGDWTYFFTGTGLTNQLGIENTTNASTALHDKTDQSKGFGYLSYLIDGTSRLSFMAGSSNAAFQIPDVPGLTPKYSLAGNAGIASANLNANQQERNQFQTASYQRSGDGVLDFQVSLFHRISAVDYQPDTVGDLIYNGIAATIHRQSDAVGVQSDASYKLDASNTLRSGFFLQHESMVVNDNALVFSCCTLAGNQTSTTPTSIQDNNNFGGYTLGLYLQNEWKATPALTVNYGARYDHVNTVTSEGQLSPRFGVVYDASDSTRWHAGYARYFTPPSSEKINTTSVALFQNTTNALPSDANTAVKAERSNYFDLGVSHLVNPQLTLGMDAYYRQVTNLQDEGQFGNALIYSAFNYAQGRIGGLEWSANYHANNFSAYGNLSRSFAYGQNISTGQFNFSAQELNYIANNWVHLDHDQAWTGSGGVSYRIGSTTYSSDLMFGSGLRNGFANTDNLPFYTQVNASVSQKFSSSQWGNNTVRLSVLNVFDRAYELRDGTGIGVGAPQWGQRRTLYLALTHAF